MTVVLKLYKKV